METADVLTELEKIVFDHVVRNNRIRFDDNGQDYPYTRKLDGQTHGQGAGTGDTHHHAVL